jgi:hypothetical protein
VRHPRGRIEVYADGELAVRDVLDGGVKYCWTVAAQLPPVAAARRPWWSNSRRTGSRYC